VQYAGIIEEHRAVRSSAGVFDVSHMAEFRVFGFAAFDYLQRLLTNDLGKIASLGSAQYTLMCDEDGGIIDDLIVYHTGDFEYLIIANAGNHQTDWDWMRAQGGDEISVVCGTAEGHRPAPAWSSWSTSPNAPRSSRSRARAPSRSSRAWRVGASNRPPASR
jgi:glycine cleavage system aminomethyltransferase T